MSQLRGPRPAVAASRPTQTATYNSSDEHSGSRHIGTLRLRGDPRQRRGVRWAEDVIDNSNMGKKKSKVCCIYHKPRAVGESSSESSSSSSESDADSEPDNSRARMGGKGAARRNTQKKHNDDHDCDHHHGDDGPETPDSSASDNEDADEYTGCPDKQEARRTRGRRASPNAYERPKTYKTNHDGGKIVPAA